jgi:DNA integrity scanning protein DisA with diadenylate cyclase activity
MPTVAEVTQYIADNVLHSKLYDSATPEVQQKAVNQAINTLVKYMSDVYKDVESLPIDELAEQVLWLLKMDDSMQRAEMGALMITVDGIQIQLKEMDRTISPKLLALHGKTSLRQRKVGSYSIGTSFRIGRT